jgi:DNA helicase II / ATP-dependent DNA helicase PcrA
MKLTDEQKDAVMTVNGNVVAIASAGSGKTSAFTTRIAYMIKSKGIDPYNIMAVTFTKKATEEMKSRLIKMIGKESANKVAMGTFHSLAYRLLKVLDKDFSRYKICPDWWKFSILNDMCKMSTDKNPNGLNLGCRAGELASFISYQKANMIRPNDELLFDERVEFIDGCDKVLLREAYSRFEQLKEESRQIDFDDILLMFYDKLKNDANFRNRISNQYRYIMIDEGQDTSLINLEIIKLINSENVYMVGDFRQSIYSFINARVDNILDFKHEFKDVKVIELNKNFRSTQNIVNLSNDIIAKSPIQKYKDYKPSESVGEVGERVKFSIYLDEAKQFNSIANEIEKLHEEDTPLSEIAILVRTNAQTAIIEDILADRDIPYDVSRAQSFFDRKEILDILSYARLAVDPSDDVSFRRIYNTPNRYLSKKFMEELDRFASDRNLPLIEVIKLTPQYNDWKFKKNIDSLVNIINEIQTQVESNVNAGRLIRNILSATKYIKYVNETTQSATSIDEKIDAIDKLCAMASKFPNIKAFLAHVGTIKDKQRKAKGKDAVQIITIHSAKGLEWDVVFVPNANEDLLPHKMNPDVEEERRLFYVACSRPRKRLFISWFFYNSDIEMQKESIFVSELIGKDKTDEMKKELFRGSTEAHTWYPSK